MDIKKIFGFCGLTGLLCFFSANAFSDELSQQGPWFAGGSLGLTWALFSENNATINNGYPDPAIQLDSYSINNPSASVSGNLFAGYRWVRQAFWFPAYSLALRYQYIGRITQSGVVDQYSLPGFENYNYTTNVASQTVNILGKLNIYQYKGFSPYVSLAFGRAFNRVTDYNESPLPGIDPVRESPNYASKMNANFMYGLGIGVDYQVNKKWLATLGYEYENLGRVATGEGASTWSGQSLSFGKLETNMVSLGVTYQLPY